MSVGDPISGKTPISVLARFQPEIMMYIFKFDISVTLDIMICYVRTPHWHFADVLGTYRDRYTPFYELEPEVLVCQCTAISKSPGMYWMYLDVLGCIMHVLDLSWMY